MLPHYEKWEEQRLVDLSAWHAAGDAGIIGISVDEEVGGAGIDDYRFRFILAEEMAKAGVT